MSEYFEYFRDESEAMKELIVMQDHTKTRLNKKIKHYADKKEKLWKGKDVKDWGLKIPPAQYDQMKAQLMADKPLALSMMIPDK